MAVALAESCIQGKRGFRGTYVEFKGRKDAALFGEAQSRIILSVSQKDRTRLDKICQKHHVVLTRLGKVGGKRLTIPGYVNLPLDQVEQAWRSGPDKGKKASRSGP